MALNADLRLWRAVLVYGLHDATNGGDAWLGSPDFALVCDLAQVEADAVLQAYAPERFGRFGRVACLVEGSLIRPLCINSTHKNVDHTTNQNDNTNSANYDDLPIALVRPVTKCTCYFDCPPSQKAQN